jgi:PAS domain-containing protein
MNNPMVLAEGLIFDGRTVVLSMAAFFGGPVVGVIAGGMAGLFRLWIGGVGVVPGLLNVLMPVLMGLAFSYLHRQGRVPFNAGTLLIFGLIVQCLQLLNVALLLPASYLALFMEHALLPLFVVLIPATILLGLLLEDIHQQKLAREELRQNEAYLSAITEAVPDLTLVLDEDGRYLKIKTPDDNLLFAGSADLLGKRLHDVLPANQADQFMQFISRTLNADTPQTLEYVMQTPSGLHNFEARARRLDTLIKGGVQWC